MNEEIDETILVSTDSIRTALIGGVEGLWLATGMSPASAQEAARVAGVRFDVWLEATKQRARDEGYDESEYVGSAT